jgi:hypothetical protein
MNRGITVSNFYCTFKVFIWISLVLMDFPLLQSVQAAFGYQPEYYSMGTRGSLPRDQVTQTWRWPLTLIMYQHSKQRDKCIFTIPSTNCMAHLHSWKSRHISNRCKLYFHANSKGLVLNTCHKEDPGLTPYFHICFNSASRNTLSLPHISIRSPHSMSNHHDWQVGYMSLYLINKV